MRCYDICSSHFQIPPLLKLVLSANVRLSGFDVEVLYTTQLKNFNIIS